MTRQVNSERGPARGQGHGVPHPGALTGVVQEHQFLKPYLGGSPQDAIEVAVSYAEVYLTLGEPPSAVAEELDRVRERTKAAGRELRFGIRLHPIARERSGQAWTQAQQLLDGLDPAAIGRAQAVQRAPGPKASAGCRRCTAPGPIPGGLAEPVAGIGLVRGGAGTALVGSHEEVADRIACGAPKQV